MRKVVLYIATTLDGYIASSDDGLDFLKPFESSENINHHIESFMKTVDTVMMGKKTYDIIQAFDPWPYQGMHAYVATHQKLFDDRVLVTDDPVQVIASEKKKAGKDIWILGGGVLIQTLLNAELIDTFVIALTPNLLGSGKKLFHPLATQIPLDLRKTEVIDGLPILTWERR